VVDAASWLRLDVIKTNGQLVTLTQTNQTGATTVSEFVPQLFNLINASPALQGPDGLVAQDLIENTFSDVQFVLTARAAGYPASGLRVRLTGSAGWNFTPSSDQVLRDNLPDLEPRNHLFVRAGVTHLDLAFPLDTQLLEDGWHELAAVAYEGSHVRSQTRATLPVLIRNTPLTGALTLPGNGAPLSVQSSITVQVSAGATPANAIRLFSTGGELAAVTNQSSATFTFGGPLLGLGRHPVWAVVEGTGGQRYRTERQWLSLVAAP
jgi:hypothetical protein